jgi:hypothetical protein
MGWPRKHESCRLYQERKDKSYLLVITENGLHNGAYEAIANVYYGPDPSLCSTSVSPLYLLNHCRRVQWSDLPDEWQRAFRVWMGEWDQFPEQIRGLWRVGEQPKVPVA